MKRLLSEFLGTFFLVFVGTGAIVVNDVSGGALTHLGVSLVFGLVVMAMIYALGEISGAHLNPAVSCGFFLAGRLAGRDLLPYIASQLGGALAASGLLRSLFPAHGTLGATLPSGIPMQSFALEFVMSFLLMFVILAVSTGAKEKGTIAGIAVGGVVALEALFGGPISGASMNPARSLGPALVSGDLHSLWIYLTAPLLGAAIGAVAYQLIRGDEPSPAEIAAHELEVASQEMQEEAR